MVYRYPSPWLATEAANKLYLHAKARVYQLLTDASTTKPQIESTTSKRAAAQKQQQVKLKIVLEENPKWRLLRSTLEEIRQDAAAAADKGEST